MGLFGTADAGARLSRRPHDRHVLDVGSTKICCLIARLKPRDGEALPRAHPHGRGARLRPSALARHQVRRRRRSRRGRAGDPLAVDAAERMAGVTVERSSSTSPAGGCRARPFRPALASAAAGRREATSAACSPPAARIRSSDGRVGPAFAADRLLARRQSRHRRSARHARRALGVDMHVVTADEAPLRNLELAINRCHLSIETVVATPYASGLAALVDDEAELGCACIDMGGGTTTHRRLPSRRVRACRRDRDRRPAHDPRHRARPLDQPRRRGAPEGAARQRAARRSPTTRTF